MQRPDDSGMNGTPRVRFLVVLLVAGFLTIGLGAGSGALAQDGIPPIATTSVNGAITPVIADHLAGTIDEADDLGAQVLIVTLDTPGGLVSSMRDIVSAFLEAPIPVVVYVSPRGADAGSAGTFITLSAHVAAMAPATTIGAATPVDIEGGDVGDKIVNNAAAYAEAIAEARDRNVEFAVDSVRDGRSITSNEALEIGAVDLIANDLDELITELDGRTIELPSGTVTLQTAGAPVEELEMSGVRRLLQRIADPNLALIFISIGTLAIVYEVANPGLGAGGIVGAVLLILAMFSLSVLPVNYAGAGLILLAAILFVMELFIPGIGVGAAGGTIALVLGALFLFQEPTGIGIDLVVLAPTVVVMFGLTVLAGRIAARSRDWTSTAGSDVLLGRTARVDLSHGRPRVRLDGTWWRARPETERPLDDGTEVVVLGRDNLELIVRPSENTDVSEPPTPDPATSDRRTE